MSSGWAELATIAYPQRETFTEAPLWVGRSVEGQIDQIIAAAANPQPSVGGLPAVVGAERLIASTIDQLVLGVDGAPTPRWLARPRYFGSDLDQGDLVQWLVTSMFWRGAGYSRCTRVGESWRLDALHPDAVTHLADATTGTRRWQVNGKPILRVPALPSQVADGGQYLLHVPYMVTPDYPAGVSPLQQARTALEGFAHTEAYAQRYTDPGSGQHSGGRLETDQDITRATAERWRDDWVAMRADGRVPVLGAGLKYVNDLVDPATAQWIEARAFNQATVYMMLGIPPGYMGASLVGGQSSLSYANAQDNDRLFRRNAVEAFTTQIEDAFTELLGRPGRTDDELVPVRFDWSKWETPATTTPAPSGAAT